MSARIPLPPQVHGAAFRTSDVGFSGLRRARLRGSDVQHPFHGVSSVDLDLESVIGRCSAFEPNLRPGQAFSHTTALALWGAPLPPLPSDIHLSVLFPRTPPRGAGVVGHSLKELPTGLVRGLPVASPASAWCQSAHVLDRADLVAAGDALLTGRRVNGIRMPGLVTSEALAAAVDRWTKRPGHARLGWALERVRAGVDSRAETLLRLLIVEGGLPEPQTDMPVVLRDGTVLHGDLGYPDARIVIEYEGDGHRTDRAAWERDIRRREQMEDAGYRVIRVTALQLFGDPLGLLERIGRRLATGA